MSIPYSILNQVERKGWYIAQMVGAVRLSRQQTSCRIYMYTTPQWLCLVSPLIMEEKREDGYPESSAQISLYYHLLQQNERMFMTKFCLDDNGDLFLTTEVPCKGANPLLLEWALEAVAHYGSKYPLELDLAKRNPLRDFTKGVKGIRLPTLTSGISKETIVRYIRGIDAWRWFIQPDSYEGTLHLIYKGNYRYFHVYLTLTKTWTYFQVPLLEGPPPSLVTDDPLIQTLFLKYVLHLNHALFMTKIGISNEEEVLLLLEFPTEILDFFLFQLAINSLATYLDRYAQVAQIMALVKDDRHLVELLAPHTGYNHVRGEP